MGWARGLSTVFKTNGIAMKMLKRILGWIGGKLNLLWGRKFEVAKPKYQVKYAEDVPGAISGTDIFIIQDGNEAELLAFKCPCGCGADILLNLLKDASPKWSYKIDNMGKIYISPSVWRSVGCKSHFFLKEDKIIWV